MKYLLELSFLGADYSGFQIQKNAPTIAGELTRACRVLLGTECKIAGCSRTDAGVHAREFYASVQTGENANRVPPERIPAALNCVLPYDIAVKAARIVPESFNPRFDTEYKEYEYVIYNSAVKNPFEYRRALPYPFPLDADELNLQAADYVGRHDFSAFMASGSDASTTVRTVKYADVRRNGEYVIFRVAADGFLYNMVRIMAGTLLYISEGKLAHGSIPDIISSKQRSSAGVTVIPDGLYLTKVILKNNEE